MDAADPLGKRTAAAALKIAVDMAAEGLIDKEKAVTRIDPMALDQLLHPTLDPKAQRKVLSRGLPASPGAASGRVVFTAEDAEAWAQRGEKVILVRVETSPEDIGGMHVAQGILTSRGGMTSHAAVVARGMGRPCVSGAGDLSASMAAAKQLTVRGETIKEGDVITIDGSTGEMMLGEVPTVQPELSGDFATLMGWADEIRTLKVRANAETPLDARTARKFGAEGIGLCRTEHMFFDADRIVAVREMILAGDEAGRRAALAKILPIRRTISSSCSRSCRACRSRSACSIRRCTNSCRTLGSRDGGSRQGRRRRCRHARAPAMPSCTKPTRCSAIAAAGSASPIRKSTRCRPAPFSRPRSKSRRRPAIR